MKRLLWVAIAVAVIAVVAGVAYTVGTNSHGTTLMQMRPFGRGFETVGHNWPGIGLLGLAGLVLFVLLLVWLIAAVVGGPGRDGHPARPIDAGNVERLRELSDMHSNGQLTDEEFAAAKRELLGL
jgi:uncharacterized membrane protein